MIEIDLSPVINILTENIVNKMADNIVLFSLKNFPKMINKKDARKLPTINSSLKKLTMRSFFIGLSKPRIFFPNINSKNISNEINNKIKV